MKLRTIINISSAAPLSRGAFHYRSGCARAFPNELAYNLPMVRTGKSRAPLGSVIGTIALSLWGCATEVPLLVDQAQVSGSVVVGRVLAVITGETARRYQPEVRFFEVEEQASQERFNVEIKSEDRHFAIVLPPGDYRLNRVQISEGPFMSMADLAIAFSVGDTPVTYVGTWRFGVDSPRYGRMVVAAMVLDQGETVQALDFLNKRYPALSEQPIVEILPQPPQMEARLYEVLPYPRYPRYFRRHWW